jgi:hypothetical protein
VRTSATAKKYRGKCERVIVAGVSGGASSSRFPGDIFVQKGRHAVGRDHRSKEAPPRLVVRLRRALCPRQRPLGPRRAGGARTAPDGRRVMSWRHLSCGGCRIRVRADAREIDLLNGSCPICGETLAATSPASSVLGFRAFDLDALSDHPTNKAPSAAADAVDLFSRRGTASERHDYDADRWTDDGGAVHGLPASRTGAGPIGASARV